MHIAQLVHSLLLHVHLYQFHSVYISGDVLDTADSRLNTDTHRGDEEGETALDSSSTRQFKKAWVWVQCAMCKLGHTSDSWCKRYLSETGAGRSGRDKATLHAFTKAAPRSIQHSPTRAPRLLLLRSHALMPFSPIILVKRQTTLRAISPKLSITHQKNLDR